VQFFVQQILNALQLGSVYALIALGYTMVYGILRMINFAHGDIFMVSTYVGFFAASFLLGRFAHLPNALVFVLMLVISMLATSLLAVFIERVAYKPLRNAPRISAVITALGVGLVLENLTLAVIGPEPRILPQVISKLSFSVGGVTISAIQLVILAISAVVMFVLDTIVRKTMTGTAMRAISFDKSVVPLMGVPTDRIISVTFALGSSIAAVGGILYGIAYMIDPYMGIRIGWWAFISAVVGGIGNIRGAMVGGYILGFVEIFVAAFLPSTYRDLVAFALLLLLLVFKPTGILGVPVVQQKV